MYIQLVHIKLIYNIYIIYKVNLNLKHGTVKTSSARIGCFEKLALKKELKHCITVIS